MLELQLLTAFSSHFLSVSGTKGLSVNDFLSGLESSGWLRHIKAVLDAAVFLVKVLCVLLLFEGRLACYNIV